MVCFVHEDTARCTNLGGSDMLKKMKNKNGNGILAFIVVISAIAIIGLAILPPLQEALTNRAELTIDYYNGTDTITELE
jgi:hypothetical protein